MFIEKSVQDQNQGSGGSNYTKITDQKLNTGDCKMNFSEELKGNQVNQNDEENVAVIGKGKRIIRHSDTRDLGNATKIVIDDGAMEIEDSAFMRFGNLKEVILPESMTKIGARAFGGCEKLVQIGLNNGITQIGEFAFSSCKGLKGISLPGSIQKLDKGAFYDCENLEKVEWENGITEVFGNAFKNCNNLKEITLPGSIQTIEGYAFKGLKGLERVRLGDGTTTISENAFRDCGNLKEISLPQSIRTIGKFAFRDCKNLIKVESSLNVNVCDKEAFKGCKKLDLSESFIVDDYFEIIGDDRFYYKKNENDGKSLIIDDKNELPLFGEYGPDESDVKQRSMGDCWLVAALASIAHYKPEVIKNMMQDNEDGTVDVTLQRELIPGVFGKETYTVKKSVFKNKDSRSIMSGSGNTIWAQMIEKAYSAYLGKSKQSIDYNNIYGGGGGDKDPFKVILGKEAALGFFGIGLRGEEQWFYKIKSALNKNTPLWYAMSFLKSLKDIDGDKVESRHSYSIIDVYKRDSSYYMVLRNPWGKNYSGDKVKSAYITVDLKEAVHGGFCISNLDYFAKSDCADKDDQEGVKVIGQGREFITRGYAEGSSWANEVIIADSVKEIGNNAFDGFSSLKKIIIPGSMKKIGLHVFYGCENLEEIELKDGIKEISIEAFRNIKKLKTISIPGSVEKIEKCVFYGCENLEEIELKDGIKEISDYAFNNIKKLKTISIPGSVKKIGLHVFYSCENLEEIELKDGIKEISIEAFRNVKRLKTISIPGSVERIGSNVFAGC